MFGIERVASGEGGPQPPASSLLPIDVPYLKAVEWLVERRIVSSSWQKSLRVAQAKLESALEAERPPITGVAEVIPAGRTRESTTYFEASRVLELLKDAGLTEKSFLGAYTNPHTARWADVVKRYESGHVHLVDTAQYLIHNVSYELPALKKEVDRAEKELAELMRRQTEYIRMAEGSRARYAESCAKRRIDEGTREQIRPKLRSSLSQLRPLYDRVARLVQEGPLVAAREAYIGLVAYSVGKAQEMLSDDTGKSSGAVGGGKSKSKSKGKPEETSSVKECALAVEAMLPVLSQLQAIDLDSIAALSATANDAASVEASGPLPSGGIDWGISSEDGVDGCGGGSGAIEVDWGGAAAGIEVGGEGGGEAAIEIDWGGGGGGGDEHKDAAAIEIDWGGGDADGGGAVDWGEQMGVEAGSSADFAFEIEVEAEGDGTCEGEQSLASIFEDAATRNQLIDDLLELQGFFTQHASELKVNGAASTLPFELQLDLAEVHTRLDAVNSALAILEDEHTRHLLLLGTSESYLERNARRLEQMLDHADKMQGRAEELQSRQAELGLLIQSIQPKREEIVRRIQHTKDEFEAALSKQFDGRRINLMGDINML